MKKLWRFNFNPWDYLCDALLKVVIVSVVTLFTLAPLLTAMAQEEGEEEDNFTLEEIIVTGTRIGGVEAVGRTVLGPGREAIKESAQFTIDNIIKEEPSIMDLGVTEMSRLGPQGQSNSFFNNAPNIHGVGAGSTLMLIDGHRVTGNDDLGTSMDILPSIGVERVEIAPGGSSAIYGSDAVAGVVNLLPRRSLNGIDTSARYAGADGMYRWSVGSAAGGVWDSGQFMVAYEHAFRSQLDASDRPYYTADQRAMGGGDYRTNQSSPGTIQVMQGRNVIQTYAIPEEGLTADNVNDLVAGSQNLGELYVGQVMMPEQKHDSGNFTFNQTFGDIEFFAQGLYYERAFLGNRAYTRGNLTVPNTNAWFVPLPDYPNRPSFSVAINYSDIPGMPMYVNVGRTNTWQVSPGLRLNLPLGFQLQALHTHGESGSEQSYNNRPGNTAAINAALASSDPATALDVYHLGRTSQEVIDSIATSFFHREDEGEFKDYQVDVTGPVLNLPGGTMKIAAGYERQSYWSRRGTVMGDHPAPTDVNWSDPRERDVDSGYIEAFIPVFGGRNSVLGLNRLEFTAAFRYDDYSDVGSTTNPSYGVNYSPIEPLMLYGSYSTSFRAPSLSDVAQAGSENYTLMARNYNLPGGGTIEGYVIDGPGDIKPESADTWTMGARYRPTRNTDINISFFSIDYDSKISDVKYDLALLANEAGYTEAGILFRGDAAAAEAQYYQTEFGDNLEFSGGTDGWPDGDPANVELFVDGRAKNFGREVTQGIDFSASYNWKTDTAGVFRFAVDSTYLITFEQAASELAARSDLLNQINQPLQFKARGRINWHYAPFTTRVSIKYVNSYDNPLSDANPEIDAWTTFDLAVDFSGDDVDWLGSFGKGLSVTLECTNVTDEDPPYVDVAPTANGSGGWDSQAANPTGRMIGISLRKTF